MPTITRLDKSSRAKIRNAIIQHGFADRELVLMAERQQLAYKVYSQIVDLETVEHLTGPWVTRSRHTFKVVQPDGGRVFGFNISGKCQEFTRGFRDVFSYGNGWWNDQLDTLRPIILPSSEKVMFQTNSRMWLKEYDNLTERTEALQKEAVQRATEIDAILSKTTNVAKLLKTWPEVKPFLPEHVVDTDNVPATADLNKALGLPV